MPKKPRGSAQGAAGAGRQPGRASSQREVGVRFSRSRPACGGPRSRAQRLEADRDALRGLGFERRPGVALHRGDPLRVAQRQLLREAEHGLEVAVDLRLGLDHHAAQLAVVVAGLDQHGRPRVALQVAHLLGLRVGPDPDLAVAGHEPHRHRVRPAAWPDAGDDRDPLPLEQLAQLPLAQPSGSGLTVALGTTHDRGLGTTRPTAAGHP